MQKNTNVLNPEEMNNLKGGGGKNITLQKIPNQFLLLNNQDNKNKFSKSSKFVYNFDIHTFAVKCP